MKIKIDPSKRITLYNHEFSEMRQALDTTIQTTLKAMIAREMDAAGIALKINIDLIKTVVKDDNAPTGTREAMKPEISARIVAAMQQRVDKKVGVIGRASNKELLVDDEGNFCLVSPEEASGQLSMFNSWDEFREAVNADVPGDAEETDDPFEDDPEAEEAFDGPESKGELEGDTDVDDEGTEEA